MLWTKCVKIHVASGVRVCFNTSERIMHLVAPSMGAWKYTQTSYAKIREKISRETQQTWLRRWTAWRTIVNCSICQVVHGKELVRVFLVCYLMIPYGTVLAGVAPYRATHTALTASGDTSIRCVLPTCLLPCQRRSPGGFRDNETTRPFDISAEP